MDIPKQVSTSGGALMGRGPSESTQCRICQMRSVMFDEAEILRKYAVKYFRCTACGFVQTEEPYWLGEAYASAISELDVGIMSRNLNNRNITCAVLRLLIPEAERSLDFGAGHGIFVRLMRDAGFSFYWHDLHASNDYARGFEDKEGRTYDLLTSFEVLEHLVDPVGELSSMMSLSPNVLVSTELLPEPAPRVSEWWYYAPAAGQHVSLYSLEALRLLAQRFGRHLVSRGPYHLFTTEPKSRFLFRVATSGRAAQVLSAFRRRPSLIPSDLQAMSGGREAASPGSCAPPSHPPQSQ